MSRPRIRTLKPEMWQDEAVGKAGPWERLLFIGLITMADDEGRMRALPSMIAGHVFPYDQDAVRKLPGWLDRLVALDLVVIYEHDGTPYAQLPSWSAHQKVNRPTPSTFPAPPLNDHGNVTALSVRNA